jgi:NAD(P)H-nitrite reductase large subunit
MDYVVIGSGPAGVVAAETLRRTDPAGTVKLIGDEPEPPYSRMAIPYFLAEDVGEEGTHLRHGAGHYDGLGIDVLRDRVTAVSGADRKLTLKSGGTMGYDRLLVAAGSHAIRAPVPGIDLDGVENCWTLEDARRIVAATKPGSRVLLMGAGFIGCIVLEALVARKVELSIVEMEDRMVPRMMNGTGGDMIKVWCEGKGVSVLTSTQVSGIEKSGDALAVSFADGNGMDVDMVVCATGVKPNIDFLDGSGIDCGTGVFADNNLATNVDGVFAAGDVAEGPELITGNREIHAIQPTATEHGRIAALNMAGHKTHYRGSLSMNVLNTLGLVSSSFGLWMGVDGGEEAEVADAGRSKYLKLAFEDDRIVGALALGLTQHVGVIRGLIQTRVRLGPWKDRLLRDPHRVMEAYLVRTQGSSYGY